MTLNFLDNSSRYKISHGLFVWITHLPLSNLNNSFWIKLSPLNRTFYPIPQKVKILDHDFCLPLQMVALQKKIVKGIRETF